MAEVLGDIEDLSVWEATQEGPSRRRRFGEDVAADLMDAWLRAQGADRRDPGMSEVRMWRERSNFSLALSTAIPLSVVIIAAAAEVRLVLAHGVLVPWVIAPLAVAVAAAVAHGWFVFKAVSDWVNGQNTLSRVFWATYRGRITVSSQGRLREDTTPKT